jgi:hypothetical protein
VVPFLLLAAVIPSRLFRDHAVVLTTVFVLVTSLWMIYANYHQVNLGNLDAAHSLPDFMLYVLSVAVPIALVLRIKRIAEIIQAAVSRVAVLVYIYAALACLGVLVVIFRNL